MENKLTFLLKRLEPVQAEIDRLQHECEISIYVCYDSYREWMGGWQNAMIPSKRHWIGLQLLVSCVVVGGAIAVSRDDALAQIAPDATLGTERTQVTSKRPGNFQLDGGATRGTNLFHSFKQFSVPTGGSAYFNNAPSIQNIFSLDASIQPQSVRLTATILSHFGLTATLWFFFSSI